MINETVAALRKLTEGYCADGGSRIQGFTEASQWDKRVPEEVYGVLVERRRRYPRRSRCHECGHVIDHGQSRLSWSFWDGRRGRNWYVHHREEDCS